ncbi:hypothetical protein [Streptomyces spiralis]|uniref:hypothetical protein n=1 Tax=Streptomyces spiralis TaxID=66376 RepID=UPI0033E152F9
MCAAPADSGVPPLDGTTASGPLSGGSDTCTSDSIAPFRAMTEVLSPYGVTPH